MEAGIWAAIAVFIAVGYGWWLWRQTSLQRAAQKLSRHGDSAAAIAAATRVLAGSSNEQQRRIARMTRAIAAASTDDTELMVNSAADIDRCLTADPFGDANAAVNAYICAGRYRAALAVGVRARELANGHVVRGLHDEILLDINLAEAEYNLGLWDAAWQRLLPLKDREWTFAMLIGGVRLQRAWVLAHQGHLDAARETWSQVRVEWFPEFYRSEFFLCRAMIELRGARPADAFAQVDAAEKFALRPSSKRNALFLRAMVLQAKADLRGADSVFATAADHPYKGQGGIGLLAWGDCLSAMNDAPRAAEAWQLCIVRDPESESATIAKRRLEPTVQRESR